MKLAHVGVKDHGEVVTLEYVEGAPADAPDLTGFMQELAPEIAINLGFAHKPLIYKDSHGVWDEVVLDGGEFGGFRSLGVIYDRDEAIKRAIELRGMLKHAVDDESAKAAIGLLTLFKDKNGNPVPVSGTGGGPMSEDELFDNLTDGLQAVVQAKAKGALVDILRNTLDSVPPHKREETFAVLDKVRLGYEELLSRMAPKIGEMVGALTRGSKGAAARKAAEEAKNEVKH